MAKVLGTFREEYEGREYSLRLTMRGLALLQDKHGPTIAGLLDGAAVAAPPIGALLDVVSIALQRGEKMEPDAADDLADALLTQDIEIVGRIFQTIFPNATTEKVALGNGKKRKAA